MFSQGGLSLEQAPPISVVFRFFVTASIFGILLGLFLVADSFGLSLTLNKSVIITHTLALGIMASFMLGSLFQMLPVIAGVVIKMPTKKAMVVHILFVVGVIIQLYAFAYTSTPLLYFLASAYLGVGLFYALFLMLKELIQIKDHSSSSKGMILSLSSFGLAILFGIYLLWSLGGYLDGSLFLQIKELHYSFALFGWLSLLIVSVSFQVVEMFYVTPKYPIWMSKYLTISIFSILIIKSIAIFMGFPSQFITALLTILFIIYGVITIHRLSLRKRPTSDATVWLWRLGIGLLICSMLITLVSTFINIPMEVEMLNYLFFIGFALSIVFAMTYKIVPFLTWFHLSNQGYIEAPMMHDIVHPKTVKKHFYIHVAMLVSLALFIILDYKILNILGAILVLASFGWLLYNLIYAIKKYNYTQKYTEKFEW